MEQKNMNRKQRREAQKQAKTGVKLSMRIITIVIALITICTVLTTSVLASDQLQDSGGNGAIKYAQATAPIQSIGFFTDPSNPQDTLFKQFEFPSLRPYLTNETGSIWFANNGEWEQNFQREQNAYELLVTTNDSIERALMQGSNQETVSFNEAFNGFGEWYVIDNDGFKYKLKYLQCWQGDFGFELYAIAYTSADLTQTIAGHIYNPIDRTTEIFKTLCVENPPANYQGINKLIEYCYKRGRFKRVAYNVTNFVWGQNSTENISQTEKVGANGIKWTLNNTTHLYDDIYNANYTLKINEDNFILTEDGTRHVYISLFGEGDVFKYEVSSKPSSRGSITLNYGAGAVQQTYQIKAKAVSKTVEEQETTTKFIDLTYKNESSWNTTTSGKTGKLVPDISNISTFNPYFNEQLPYIYITEYQYIFDIQINEAELSTEELKLTLNIPYDITPPTIDNWILGYLGNFNLSYGEKVEFADGTFLSWLSNTVSGFMNAQVFGAISIGALIWFVVGLGCLFAVLKYFAGG